MAYIVKDKKLELKHEPGNGSWTYHLKVPHTKGLPGKWGDIKVSGSIDGYLIEYRNLAPIKGEDKLLSVNSSIRKAINKGGGEVVTVTLHLLNKKQAVTEKQVLESFRESDVNRQYKSLSKAEQNVILQDIAAEVNDAQQIKKSFSTLMR